MCKDCADLDKGGVHLKNYRKKKHCHAVGDNLWVEDMGCVGEVFGGVGAGSSGSGEENFLI